MNKRHETRNGQNGFTLAEVMVAMMIFVIVVTAALLLYDRSNIVFKQSVEASDMQQSTRVAFDKLVGDIRLAGFDYDRDGIPMSSLAVMWVPNTTFTIGNLVQPNPPNGHTYVCTAGGTTGATQPTWPTGTNDAVNEGAPSTVKWREAGTVQYQQPDEQIEYAGQRAITIRANFDYETDAAHENGREQDPNLESSPFQVVTTGNDEIVTYALKSADSTKNVDSITFYADTDIPRDVHPGTKKKEKLVTISGVDLTGNNPPYSLVRFTLDNSGNPDAGTPIADNIRDVSLTYYKDTAGTVPIAVADLPLGKGQYDGSKPDDIIAERDLRAEVKSVQLVLTGMNPQSDAKYNDTSDTIAPSYRKYKLASMIVPRNLGRRGMREFNVEQPGKPTVKSICTGGCNAVYLTWEAPTGVTGDIDSYSILYDDDSCSGGFSYSEDAGVNLDGYAGRFIVPGKTWYFAVQAINKFGAKTSDCVSAMVKNSTKPEAPTGLVATGGGDAAYPALPNQIDLYFPPVSTNVDSNKSASCNTGGVIDQKTMPNAEKRYYEIIRGRTINFQPGDPGVEKVLTVDTTQQPTLAGTVMKWTDAPPANKTANCFTYYYRVRAVDYCSRDAAMNIGNDATLGTSAWFPAPADNAQPGRAEENSTKPETPTLQFVTNKNCGGGKCDVQVSWAPISRDAGVANGPDIFIDQYVLRVYRKTGGVWPTSAESIYNVTGGLTTYDIPALLQSQEYRFTLTALDCLESAESAFLYWPCNFGTTTIDATVANYGGAGTAGSPWIIQPPAALTATATGAVSKFEVSVYVNGTQVGATQTVNNPAGNTANFTIPDIADDQVATVRLTATDPSGQCSISTERFVVDEPPPSCALRDINSDASVLKFTSGSNTLNLTLKNTANDETLTLKKVTIKWNTNLVANGDILETVTFPTSSGTTTVTANCVLPSVLITVPATAKKVNPSQTDYGININFGMQGNKKLPSNPITAICVEYTSSTGDLKQCSVAPNAGDCTSGTAACQ